MGRQSRANAQSTMTKVRRDLPLTFRALRWTARTLAYWTTGVIPITRIERVLLWLTVLYVLGLAVGCARQ